MLAGLHFIKSFVPNAPFLYSLKTSENLRVFWRFQGVEEGCIGNEWVKSIHNQGYRKRPLTWNCGSSHPEVFLRKRVLKICSKFAGEHPCRSAISLKLHCNFIEIALRHGCSTVNFLCIFRTPFLRTNLGGCFWNWLITLKKK